MLLSCPCDGPFLPAISAVEGDALALLDGGDYLDTWLRSLLTQEAAAFTSSSIATAAIQTMMCCCHALTMSLFYQQFLPVKVMRLPCLMVVIIVDALCAAFHQQRHCNGGRSNDDVHAAVMPLRRAFCTSKKKLPVKVKRLPCLMVVIIVDALLRSRRLR
jgi:hypothetical protein